MIDLSFEQVVEAMSIHLEQAQSTVILFALCDDSALRRRAVAALRARLSGTHRFAEFHYSPEHVSLLEGVAGAVRSASGPVTVLVTGLSELSRDKRSEAIKLLNIQRDRLGSLGLAVVLWLDERTLTEVATRAADFYSWRSTTFTLPPPPGWEVSRSQERAYLEAVIADTEYVALQGLAPTRAGHVVQMRMDDVFIPLRAAFRSLQTRRGSLKRSVTGPEAETGADSDGRTGRGPGADGESFEVEASSVLAERCAVVLGDPGAGKTTFLRYLAHAVARDGMVSGTSHGPGAVDASPFYIRVSELAQHLLQQPSWSLEASAPAAIRAQRLPLADGMFERLLAENRVVLLLDGLDEIVDHRHRDQVAREVAGFAQRHPLCHVIVTSRIVGYRSGELGPEFAEYTIAPLQPDEISRFIDQWYAALDMPEAAAELQRIVLTEHSAIGRLASNPLLLTVIALIHFRQARLPHERVKLYSLASETLVDQWMNYRRVSPEGWDVHETLHVLLPAIAWSMHHTTSIGLIDEVTLHRLLVDTIRERDDRIDDEELHARASRFRKNVSEFSGIFLERGVDDQGLALYGFLHLTFQEYFAARYLAAEWERAGDGVLGGRLHDPRWTEIVRLACGHLSESSEVSTTRFLRAIIGAGSRFEALLHRDLEMAVRCLGDDVRVTPPLRRQVVSDALAVLMADSQPELLRARMANALSLCVHTASGPEILEALAKGLAAESGPAPRLAAHAASSMGLAAASPALIAALTRLLAGPDEEARMAAVGALAQIGQAHPARVVESATPLMTAPEPATRAAALDVLTQLGADGVGSTAEVLQMAADPDTTVRLAVARMIRRSPEMFRRDPALVRLLSTLISDPSAEVREAAAETVMRVGEAALIPDLVAALERHLTDPAAAVRLAAADALGSTGSPAALDRLVGLLADPEAHIAADILRGLEPPGVDDATAPDWLSDTIRRRLCQSDYTIGFIAAVALSRLEVRSSSTRNVIGLLRSLLTSGRSTTPSWAARVLYEWGAVKRAELAAVTLPLLADPDVGVRLAASMALRMSMPSDDVARAVIDAHTRLLAEAEPLVRFHALVVIGDLSSSEASPDVASAVSRSVSDANHGVRAAALRCIGQRLITTALPEVVQALADPDDSVRKEAGKTLVSLAGVLSESESEDLAGRVASLATSPDVVVRDAAYQALARLA